MVYDFITEEFSFVQFNKPNNKNIIFNEIHDKPENVFQYSLFNG